MNIVDLMNVPATEHDAVWLKEALQNAVKLELATIPPYLCAWWSIKEDLSVGKYVTKSIKEIVFEEMAHLGLACNMLTTIGETPKIFPDAVPSYPKELPGGVKPGLKIHLRKLDVQQLSTFMEIESPEIPIEPQLLALAKNEQETFPTIGKFYEAILTAFQNPNIHLTGERQLTITFPNITVFKLENLVDVGKAINQITRQGEGTAQFPTENDNLSRIDLAHFYRFREIKRGHKFIKNAEGKWVDDPNPLSFPKVYDIADVPEGGYTESLEFDKLYTILIKTLHHAWENGAQDDLDDASFNQMGELSTEAINLMQKPIDPTDLSKGNFAPSFLLIP